MASIFHQPHTFNFHFFNKSSWTCCPMGVAMSLNSTQELKYISLRVQVSPARFSDFFRFFAGTRRRPSPSSSLLRSHTFLWEAASPFWLMGFLCLLVTASFRYLQCIILNLSPVLWWYPPDHRPNPGYTPRTWLNLPIFCCLHLHRQVTCLRTLCGGVSLARRQLDLEHCGICGMHPLYPCYPLFNWRLPSVTPQLDHSPDARCQACASTRDCCNLHHTQPQHLMWILPTKDSQHMSTLQLRWTLKHALQMPSVFGANHPRQTWKQNLDASLGTETLRCTGLNEVSQQPDPKDCQPNS